MQPYNEITGLTPARRDGAPTLHLREKHNVDTSWRGFAAFGGTYGFIDGYLLFTAPTADYTRNAMRLEHTKARNQVFAILIGLSSVSSALSAELLNLDVALKDKRYHMRAETHLDALPAALYDVLIDYDEGHFGRISEIYKESDYLAPDTDGTPLVYTRVEGCLLFYCRSMRRVERLEVVKPRFIQTTTLPERSDFRYSVSQWILEPEGEGTRITYRLDMEPDFWLPPFVGPWYLKRTLKKGGVEVLERIEQLARDAEVTRAPGGR